MPSKNIPDKLFYKIGEVAKIVDVEPYVLRYWESEFGIKLSKSKNKQRLYQKKDIETVQKIKRLLYEERYTIEGAKKKLKERKRNKKGSEELTAGQLALDLKTPKHRKSFSKLNRSLKHCLKLPEPDHLRYSSIPLFFSSKFPFKGTSVFRRGIKKKQFCSYPAFYLYMPKLLSF